MSKKQVIGVFCTDADLQHPKLIEILKSTGLVSESDIDASGHLHYSEEQLQKTLYLFFGFSKGWYEKEFITSQTTRFTGERVSNSNRYVGTERQDKDWISNPMCSQETREIVKWGTVL